MKAAQIVAPRRFDIVDIPTPDLSQAPPNSLLVRVGMTAICGTDMPAFAYDLPSSSYPSPPGYSQHECIGIVVSSTSQRFREGDEVLALPNKGDGLAEYFVAHENVTIPLTPYPRKECVLMAQPLGTVVWALRKLGNLLNKDTVVVGQGPIGLMMTAMLSNLGARTIIALDILDYRLAVSRTMRATHTINVSNTDPVEIVREVTEGRMADLVVEVVGHQTETINRCLDLVKRGGTILAFGVPDDEYYSIRFSEIFRQNVTLICSVGPDVQNDFPLAMDFITQGRIDVSPIISHIIPFTEAQRGFEMSLTKEDGAIKVVFTYT
ncbi:MAG: zinc-binding dehydrogenase [Candidatus Latescibacteria bacterium]|nr:zinc-binding dehydrogenase [Candidatus Latescibacterota bacterium]